MSNRQGGRRRIANSKGRSELADAVPVSKPFRFPWPEPTLRRFELETDDDCEAARLLRGAFDQVVLVADVIARLAERHDDHASMPVVALDGLREVLTDLLDYKDVPWPGYTPRAISPEQPS